MNKGKKINGFKPLTFVIMILISLCTTMCSKDSGEDLQDLLKTVPSDAGMVVALDVKKMAEKAGAKTKDGKITFQPEMVSSLVSKGISSQTLSMLEKENGVEMTSIVFFSEGYYFYVTGLLRDSEAFKKCIADESAGKVFEKEGDVEICDKVAVKGSQFWIGDTSSAVSTEKINSFSALSRNQSFLSCEYSETLLKMDHDIEGIADINSLFSRMNNRSNMGMVRLIAGAVFSDPSYMAFSAEFEKGEAEVDVRVLDSKFKICKYLLPKSNISSKTLKELKGSGDMIFAMGISDKLVETLLRIGGSLGGSIESVLAPFKCIDGTVAVVTATSQNNLEGVIDINNQSTTALSALCSSAGFKTRTEGNRLYISSATMPSGKLTGDGVMSELKDAMVGIAFTDGMYDFDKGLKGKMETGYLLLEPFDNSLKLKLKIKFINKKENSLKILCGK